MKIGQAALGLFLLFYLPFSRQLQNKRDGCDGEDITSQPFGLKSSRQFGSYFESMRLFKVFLSPIQ